MNICQDAGDPLNPIWVVLEEPYSRDYEAGYILSGGYGYVFKKTWNLSASPQPFITCFNPDITISTDLSVHGPVLISRIKTYKPKIIVALGDSVLNHFCPSTIQKGKKTSALNKWAGSLLKSPLLDYDHYVIGTYTPEFISTNYQYHEIVGYIDLGHVKEEYDFLQETWSIKPLPTRTIITNPTYETLTDYLRFIIDAFDRGRISYVSTDIETLRPRKGTTYFNGGHCGYPYTNSFAPSSKEAISYCLWDYIPTQATKIWRLTNDILMRVPQIGQNYYSFDSHYFEALGFSPNSAIFHDTLLRHHILWPGLPHKLQFQTKQYTREPYYKDEGKNWSVKQKQQLMKYNCLDTMITYEIFEGQEKEFDERPHLR